MLHITNGDNAAELIKTACGAEDIIAWRDILYEGPVQNLKHEVLSKNRAKYLASVGYGELESIQESFQERDRKLSTFNRHDEIVLWFEHDTYDQLQLIQVLTWFTHQNIADVKLSLICINHFPGITPFLGLGQLDTKQIKKLYPTRELISETQLQLATTIWEAFASSDPTRLTSLLKEDLSALPYVKNALVRYLREFPSAHNGLSWTEEFILESIETGISDFSELFQNMPLKEKDYFLGMGDSTFKNIIKNFITTENPLIQCTDTTSDDFKNLKLTSLGSSVLSGKKDWITLNGIDLWRGGIHLTVDSCYRLERNKKGVGIIHIVG